MSILFEQLLRNNFRFGRMLSSRIQIMCGCHCHAMTVLRRAQ